MYPTHHALLYIGNDSFNVSDFEKEREETHDVIVQRYAELRINDARSLISMATQSPMHKSKQCFVVLADSIAIEAQNALLKVLEEPPAVSSFVFVLPLNTLLPTLRSRFMIMGDESVVYAQSTDFLEFLACDVPTRLAMISTLHEKKKTAELISLREGLLNYLKINRRRMSTVRQTRIHWLITQMPLRGSSSKMLWDDTAFTLPIEV